MTFSLNEIEAEVKKAVRGAGLTWGLAEEGAKAARWLASYGIDPLPSLIDVLDRRENADNISTAMTRTETGHWQAAAPICPILFGATLCDHAHELGASSFSGGPVARPLLVVPFVARTARALRRHLRLFVADADLRLSENGALLSDIRAVDRPYVPDIRAAPGMPIGTETPEARRTAACRIDPSGWSRLSDFAQRTCVPATERSRLEGAGAGAIDND